MKRLVTLVLISGACVLAAHAALAISPPVAQWLSQLRLAAGRLPGAFEIALAALSVLLVSVSRPGLFALYSGTIGYHFKTAVLASVFWAAGGAGLWLVAVYFLSDLSTLDRGYTVVFGVALVPFLIAVSLSVRLARPIRQTLLSVAPMLLGLGVATWATGAASGLAGLLDPPLTAGVMLQRLVDPPVVYLTTFVLAAGLAWIVLLSSARFRSSSGAMFVVRLLAWVVLLHLIWILVLFAVGHADLPHWVPVGTALATGLAILVAVAGVLLGTSGSFSDRFYARFFDQSRSTQPGMTAEIVMSEKTVPHANGRRAWIISFTGVSNEPRVLRQAKAMTEAGWDLVICGFDGHSNRPEEWKFIRLPKSEPYDHRGHRLAALARVIAVRGMALARLFGLGGFAAHVAHGSNLYWHHIRRELVRVANERADLKADLVIAHDYHTSDVGYEVAQVFGAKFSIDLHEYAREQYSNIPEWGKWEQPVIVGVQDYYLRRADNVTVVCQGIADLLEAETPLKVRPTVIRNFPFPNVQSFRPVGDRIKVLYHGDLSRPRQIHIALQSMPKWRADIDLILRGNGDAAYIGELKRQVERLGLQTRVFFEPAVPFDKIVEAANQADIGFFSYEAYSPQIRFALPNKLFEYVMAGLAVCISDLEEVGRVVNGYRLGKLIPQHTPDSISETVNSFTRHEIETFKKASLEAARELNWNAESKRLLSSYAQLFS